MQECEGAPEDMISDFEVCMLKFRISCNFRIIYFLYLNEPTFSM